LLYVASGGSNKVVKFDPQSGMYLGDLVTSGSGGLSGLIGIEFGPDGNLYAASLNTNSVKRCAGDSGSSFGDFVTSGSGGLAAPNFITFATTIPEPNAGTVGILALTFLVSMRRRFNAGAV
jgi:DNA-binding beta-propeller fold protein YncE